MLETQDVLWQGIYMLSCYNFIIIIIIIKLIIKGDSRNLLLRLYMDIDCIFLIICPSYETKF